MKSRSFIAIQSRIFCILLSIMLLSACSMIGPDFKRPELVMKQGWLKANKSELKRGDNREWWKGFNDPVLNQLIAKAYRQNLNLQKAALRILEARAQRGIARGSLFPQSQQFSTGFGFNRLSENSANFETGSDEPDFLSLDMGFDALWEIDLWGRFRRGVESADAKLAVSLMDYNDIQISLSAEVAVTYIQIRSFQQRLKLAVENADIQKQSLHITTVRMNEGISSELDMQQAKALLHSTESLIATLQIGFRQAKNALNILLANYPGEIDALIDTVKPLPQMQQQPLLGMPADLLRRRPDVRRAEFQAAAQSALIGVAKADLLPRFTLRGALGLNASNTGAIDVFDVFDMKSLAATVGPTVSWPILNYGRLKNNVRVQDARLEQRLLAYRETVLKAVREVEDAIVAFQQTKKQVEHLQQSVVASKRAVELSLLQYRDGIEDYTRVLNSQQFLVQMQDQLINNRGANAKHLMALYKALGGGWDLSKQSPVIPASSMERMQQRTDWGNYLEWLSEDK